MSAADLSGKPLSDYQIRAALRRMQEDALSRGDHPALYRAAGVSRDWARGFLGRDHVIRFLNRVHTDAPTCNSDRITDEMVTAARDELIARINNKIQPTPGTMRAVLEAARAVTVQNARKAELVQVDQ